MDDVELIDEVVEAVRSGSAVSRSEIAAAVGISTQRAATILGRAVRSHRLKLAGRDCRNSPTYEIASGTRSQIVAEVC